MKLSLLLTLRPALLRQAHLAGLAFAYWKLREFATRIARAQLRGDVHLQQAEAEAGRYWASLTALAGSQSVIEEHFTDEDLMDLADLIAFVTGETQLDLTFRIEQLAERFVTPLRLQLEQAGVIIDEEFQSVGVPSRGRSSD
jgi:hypothetical protein